ncbi:serine hydrolase domain-containing protein [Inquilinus sp.]|jgi:D-aminopeptidase|uniref:serine hydrolase domain-containing protein n=1 Tax=Inquilinus sp. TaxID=1932117 RepID=UPI00378419E1
MAPDDTSGLPADLSARIDTLFAPWAKADSPGAVVAVRRHGREIHRGCYGLAQLPHRIPLSGRSVMRIASQTKQFTVLLALMLETEGKLSLQDDVRSHLSWLPEFPRTVTLQHLAANVSGLRDYVEIMELGGQSPLSPAPRAMLRRVIGEHAGVNFPAGDDLIYCNAGFLLLYEVIEQVAGLGFNELLRDRITGPLGMNQTLLLKRDDEIVPHLADHHTKGPDGAWRRAWAGEEANGDGGIVSSADDMQVWLANLNDPKVGAAELARMARPGATVNGRPSPYGLGLVTTDYRGHRSIGHGGAMAGARSEGVRFPDLGLDIVILANTDDIAPFSLARRIVDAVLDRPPGPPHSAEAGARLAAAAGLYHDAATDDVFAIAQKDGVPVLGGNGGKAQIEEVEPEVFQPERGIIPLRLALRPDGGIDADWFGRKRHYRRLSDGPAEVPADAAGRYGDPALALEAEIVLEGETARLRLRSSFAVLDAVLRPVAPGLLLARPVAEAEGPEPEVPSWLCAVRVLPDAIVINNDRTRGLRLPRLS